MIDKVIPKIESLNQSRISQLKDQQEFKGKDSQSSRTEIPLTREHMENIADALNSAAKSVDKKISFSFHEKTQRMIMRIQDPQTSETIREIPPKEMIRLLEHMQELIGMFVDESR